MTENIKGKKLNEEELEQVTGGIAYRSLTDSNLQDNLQKNVQNFANIDNTNEDKEQKIPGRRIP